jgi:hypothetical protein
MKRPQNVAEVRTFLGMSGFYRKYIEKFSDKSAPLVELTTVLASNNFSWNESQETSWLNLKDCLVSAPILCHPNFDFPFVLQTDASDIGLGATLVQYIDGRERTITYLSRTTQPAEMKWAVREKEALAIIWACESLRPYLIGNKFIVETDHDSLVWLHSAKTPARLVRWACRLSEFDFDIKYRPGKSNQRSDCLSRMPLNEVSDDMDLMPDRVFCTSIQQNKTPTQDRHEALFMVTGLSKEQIKICQLDDPLCRAKIEECEREETRATATYMLHEREQLLCRYSIPACRSADSNRLLVIPLNLRELVLRYYHDHCITAHLSGDRVINLLKKRFWWPRMSTYVREYIKSCSCQRVKLAQPLRNGLLLPIEATRPGQIWVVDIVGPIWRSAQSNKYILVAIDSFTNWPVAGVMKQQTAEEVVRLFFNLVIKEHGTPENILSDSGTQFMSDAFDSLCKSFNIKKTRGQSISSSDGGKS